MRSRRSWGSHGYVTAIGMSSLLVRQQATAYMRDWRGSHPITSYEPSSSGLPPTIHMKLQETHMLWCSAVWWQACEVKWQCGCAQQDYKFLAGLGMCWDLCIFPVDNDAHHSVMSVVKLFLKFVQICSNKFIEENWERAKQESKDLKIEHTVEIIVNKDFHKYKQGG